MEMKFEVAGKIKAPLAEVFDAVYNPKKLSGYFTTGGASAPLDEGTEVMWEFADHPGAFPIQVKKTIKNELIIFEWENIEKGMSRVEMKFEAIDNNTTMVKIKESGWKKLEQRTLDSSYGNCRGWSQMHCFLKAYVEHGINLREGYF